MATIASRITSARDKADRLKSFVEDIQWDHDDVLEEIGKGNPGYLKHEHIDTVLSATIEMLGYVMDNLDRLLKEV